MLKKFKVILLVLCVAVVAMLIVYLSIANNVIQTSNSEKLLSTEDNKYYKELDSLLKYDNEKADVEIEKLYNRAKNYQDSLKLAYAYFYKVLQSRKEYNHNNDSIFVFLNNASVYGKNTSDESLKARINIEYGIYYSSDNKYFLSLEYYLKAKDYFEKENRIGIGQVYGMLGTVYYMLGEIEEGLEYHNKAYEIFKKRGDSINIAAYYVNSSKILLRQKKYDQARKQLLAALKTFESLKDIRNVIAALVILSDIEQNDKNIIKSQDYLDKAYDLTIKLNDSILEGHLLLHYGNIYEKDNKVDEAMKLYNEGYQMIGTYSVDYANLKNIADLCFKTNRHKDAYVYLDKYYEIRDSVNGKDIKTKIEVLQYKNKLQQYQYEKEIKDKEYKRKIYIYLIIIISTLFIALFIWFLYREKTKNLEITKLKNDRLEERIEVENIQYQLDMQLKNHELTGISIELLEKNKLFVELLDILQNNQNVSHKAQTNRLKELVRHNSNQEKDWERFKEVFQKLHPNFFQHIEIKYSQLSKTEMRICSYIKINMNNGEIASLLGISHKSLISARYRIRKKLNLDQSQDLDKFISSW